MWRSSSPTTGSLRIGSAERFGDLAGAQLSDRAFLSTTLLRSLAERYCRDSGSPHRMLAEILVPGGAEVGAPDLVLDRSEYELLLPRDSALQVRDVHEPTMERSFRLLILEVIA